MNFSTEWTIPSGERSFRSILRSATSKPRRGVLRSSSVPCTGEVVCYDRIHASPTIGREDGSFGYGFFEYFSDLHEFIRAAERETERVKAADGLCLGAGAGRTDLIYFSAVPWFAFTEMKHARSANRGDSIPRISTGKLTRSGDRLTMPVSLDVHHGFIDGRQAGEFFALLENRE